MDLLGMILTTRFNLKFEVKLIDSAGIEVYTFTINTLLNYHSPGETSLFSDYSAEPYPDGKTMQATVVSFNQQQPVNM
jgi:hypothetical protein